MLRVGILGGADIAYRMFLPAIKEADDIECIGVASKTETNRIRFAKEFNIPIFDSYDEIIENPSIDIVYIPLPPALHYKWAKKALENNKHVLLEKPSTTCYADSKELVSIAASKGLVLQENYMFQYHSQIYFIKELLSNKRIGDIHLIKSSFGFPRRNEGDFRYNYNLGGGALLDVGGYIVKIGTLMLGNTIKITTANSNFDNSFGVDLFGSVSFTNSEGLVFQGSFGMDCHYQCSLEIWGSKGKISTNRIFTAPPAYQPVITIEDNNGIETIKLSTDNHFLNSIKEFVSAVCNNTTRTNMYSNLLLQAQLVEDIKRIGGNHDY